MIMAKTMAKSLLTRLNCVDCCALCDASGKLARVVETVRPLRAGTKMAGRAFTVRLVPGDFLTNLVAIEKAQRGDVLMIDAGYRAGVEPHWPVTGGMFGELLAAEAQRKGLAGMVIDGNCRDTPMTRAFEIPIFSRGVHPNAGTATQLGAIGEPVQMGSVTVETGDLVLGDDDGIVVATEAELETWLPAAEAIVATESSILSQIQDDGRSLFEMTSNYEEHLAAVKRGEASKLGFQP
tara:strand:+ start:292 stop:1002 length:711 start_codon:yes stop_codon:yes gene_type:complete